VLAGALLGLAIGTKEWALLVVPAVFAVGLGPGWRPAAVACLAVVTVTVGMMAVGSPSTFREAHQQRADGAGNTLTPASIWWRAGERQLLDQRAGFNVYNVYPPKQIGRTSRPFVALLGLVGGLLLWRRGRHDAAAAFALAGFLLVARVVFDTQTYSYHVVPMLMVVTAWEVVAKRRFPFVALATMVAFQLTARGVFAGAGSAPDTFNAIYLAWTLPLLGLLAFAALRRPRVNAARPA
jgi:hypothetical protein